MHIEDITYLDIGAHDAIHLSNTYLFYRRGSRGVLVEPDPTLHAALHRKRPRDVCLNVGASTNDSDSANFFIMSTPTLNTFSETEAKRYAAMGTHRIDRVLPVRLVSLQHLIDNHFGGNAPTFLSIDIEGLDYEVLKSLNLQRHRPAVVCVETLTYSETRTETKDPRIAEHMLKNDYFVYGDTYINTIFVDRVRWQASA